MNKLNPKVDKYINKAQKWQEEFEKLRTIFFDCNLSEELKWGTPCYMYETNNIALIIGFKEYCGISFFKGSLLKDTNNILIKPGENTQSGRIIRFTSLQEIIEMESILKDYIYQAIEIEKAGLKVEFKKATEFIIPEELQNKFDENPDFKKAFYSLTPGRQKAYFLYFSDPKQAKTRQSRVEKSMPLIFDGKGLNDCTCGLSKRMPACDGSHKYIQ